MSDFILHINLNWIIYGGIAMFFVITNFWLIVNYIRDFKKGKYDNK